LTDSMKKLLFPDLLKAMGNSICKTNLSKLTKTNTSEYIKEISTFLNVLEDDLIGKNNYERQFDSKKSKKKKNVYL